MGFNFFQNNIFLKIFYINLDTIVWKKIQDLEKYFWRFLQKCFKEHSPQINPLSRRVLLMLSSWCPFMWYNCMDANPYATRVQFLDGWHVLWVMNLSDNICDFPFIQNLILQMTLNNLICQMSSNRMVTCGIWTLFQYSSLLRN
jgi:hypothetical protein